MAVEFSTPQPESHTGMENILCNDFFFISNGNMSKNTVFVAVNGNPEPMEAIFKTNKYLILAAMHPNTIRHMVAEASFC